MALDQRTAIMELANAFLKSIDALSQRKPVTNRVRSAAIYRLWLAWHLR